MNLKILFEDTHVIVCYKPAGMPTQTSKIGSQDMVSILKNYLYKNQKERKEPYVAVIHRLDQPVEGILVFGKTPFAAKELSSQMQGAGFGKYYKAVVCGKFEEKSGKLEHYMVKDGRSNLSKVCEPSAKNAKSAGAFLQGRKGRNGRWRREKSCKYQIGNGAAPSDTGADGSNRLPDLGRCKI